MKKGNIDIRRKKGMTNALEPKVKVKVTNSTIRISAKVDEEFVQDIPEFLATNARGIGYIGKRIWRENRACYFLVTYRGNLYHLAEFAKKFGKHVLTLTKCPFTEHDTAFLSEYKYRVEYSTSEYNQNLFSWYYRESEKEKAMETFKELGGEDCATFGTVVI